MKLDRLISTIAILLIATATLFAQQSKDKKMDQPKGNPVVVMKTSMGTIKIELFEDKAPVTVKNFLSYVDEKYFNGTVFHRVIKGFMIQGGGFEASDPIKQKPTKAQIINESDNGLKNERGTLAMARTNDPNSATSQFFINVVDNSFLNKAEGNPGYAVFAKVIEGMDVVDKIRAVKTGTFPAISLYQGKEIKQQFQDVPETKVVIESITRAGK
ncbi:MAG: peptidylprolyl isomerase [Ignavibacteriales bacterium]|nr:peptidylprolyl isomerase [Ignavibacteriales bacterium]